ncbi:fimbrial protein [Haemophilus sp. C1]|uniref:fimbrial protein n=1 Tax=Haemophilus sp. C1 TaxID=1661745 RepID=UPI0006ABDFB9|nr:fimbrial protein [Haemophilus sp. C1]
MKKTILALLALGVFGVANATSVDGEPRTAIKPAGTAGAEIPYQRATTTADNTTRTHAKITVKGKVVDSTCEIKTDSRNQTVQLKSVGVNQLTKVGDVAADHLVQIKLENCQTKAAAGAGTTAGTGNDKVTVTFNATNKIDNYFDGTLKNQITGATAAQNVNIQFANLNGTSIRLGTNDPNNTLTPTTNVAGGEHVIEFLARYFATGPSKAGEVQGEAELDLAYE